MMLADFDLQPLNPSSENAIPPYVQSVFCGASFILITVTLRKVLPARFHWTIKYVALIPTAIFFARTWLSKYNDPLARAGYWRIMAREDVTLFLLFAVLPFCLWTLMSHYLKRWLTPWAATFSSTCLTAVYCVTLGTVLFPCL